MNKTFLTISVMAAAALITSPTYAGIFSDHAQSKNDSMPPVQQVPDTYPAPQERDDPEPPSKSQRHERSETGMNAGYNAPEKVDAPRNCNVFGSVGFIFWMPMQDKFDLGVKANNASSLPGQYETNIPFDFKYRPGFKVGLGLNLPYDNWSLGVEWTRLSGNETTRKGTSLPQVVSSQWQISPNNGFSTHITASWDFLFNLIDLAFSRPCYVGTKLIFTPFFGGRLFYNHQHVRSHAHSTSSISVLAKSKQKLWELGPRAGMNSGWLLGKGFRMEGDLGFSLLYANIRTRHKEKGWIGPPATSDILAQKSRTHSQGLRPNVDIGAGFGWGSYFNHQKEHIDFLAKYEFLCFWDNNNLSSNLGAGGMSNLYFQGLTFTAKLDF
jgi:hypothetical protein